MYVVNDFAAGNPCLAGEAKKICVIARAEVSSLMQDILVPIHRYLLMRLQGITGDQQEMLYCCEDVK